MGSKNSKEREKINRLSLRFDEVPPEQESTCPICGRTFSGPESEYLANKHYKKCALKESNKPINHPPSENFGKLSQLRSNFDSIKVSWMKGFEKIHISRQDFFWDSMQKVLAMSTQQLRSEFQIEFLGEKSQDAGGLTKEWLNLLIVELLSDNFNVFRVAQSGDRRYKITQNQLDPEFYVLSGRIIGKALLENIPINCPLSFVVLKYVLDWPVVHEDIKFIDNDVYKAIEYIKNNSIEGVFYETFSVSDENGKIYELVPDGQFMQVTDENKEIYISLRLEYELNSSILNAINWLKDGIFAVFPKEFIRDLTPEELDLIICGNPTVNIHEWRSFTEYRGEFNERHKVVKWFWDSLAELTQEDLRALLMFVTGTDRVPVGGFQNLKTTRGEPARFTLEPYPYSKAVLPRAHTCFNRMDLPLFRSKEELKRALIEVIKNHTFGFGLE
jgi:hypothetical protein